MALLEDRQDGFGGPRIAIAPGVIGDVLTAPVDASGLRIGNIGGEPINIADRGADIGIDGDPDVNDAVLAEAITEAAASDGQETVIIPGLTPISTRIDLPSGVQLKGFGGTRSKFLWVGSDGGTMLLRKNADRGGMAGVGFDCNSLAANGVIIDGGTTGHYEDIYITGFTTGDGMLLTSTELVCDVNTFQRLHITNSGYTGAGVAHSCLWIGRDPDTPVDGGGNACHNVFINLIITHEGTTPGIILGNSDNNAFYTPLIFRGTGTGAGVLVDPTEAEGMPIENVFVHLQAGEGGWVQPNTTTEIPATIYGYHLANAQPLPVTNGTPLIYYFPGGYAGSVAPTLQNSWVNFGGALRSAGYWKDPMGYVRLEGVIKNGTMTFGTTIFQLPVGYRPTATVYFAVAGSGAKSVLTVDTSGNITTNDVSDNAFLSLSGISFRTD